MFIALGDSPILLEVSAETERLEIVFVGLYKAFRRVLTFEDSWLLLKAQSLISGYEYPNSLVVQDVADVHRVPESSE